MSESSFQFVVLGILLLAAERCSRGMALWDAQEKIPVQVRSGGEASGASQGCCWEGLLQKERPRWKPRPLRDFSTCWLFVCSKRALSCYNISEYLQNQNIFNSTKYIKVEDSDYLTYNTF